jgi:hypothetical protein
MKQLCDDLRQFAIQVRRLGYSVGPRWTPIDAGVRERECLDLSERMLAAVKRAEARMASVQSTPVSRPPWDWRLADLIINRVVKGGFPAMSPLNTVLRTCAAYEPEFRPILDEYCAGLDLEGCFDGLSASEAHLAAIDIVLAVCGRDDPADYLRQRADQMVASALAISRSLRIAAAVW